MSTDDTDGRGPKDDGEMDGDLVLPGDEGFQIQAVASDEEEDGLEVDDRQTAEIREIFGTAFPQYLQPIEEIIQQIFSDPDPDPDSLEALTGMLASLMEASSRMGFSNISELLDQLKQHLAELDPEFHTEITVELRQEILGDLLDLKEMAQEMGGQTAEELGERQQTIFSALKDKEDVGKLTLKRLSAAGLITVDQLLMAKPEEIAVVAGIGIDIVHRILGHLREGDSGKQAAGATPKRDKRPDEIEALHEVVLEKLRAEAEIEAYVEELKAEIRGLRSRIHEYRAELKSLDVSLNEKVKAWDAFSKQMAHKAEILDELGAKRDALKRRYESTEEVIQRKEVKLFSLRQERRKVEEETLSLSQSVGRLIDRVGQVRRSVVRKRLV